MGLVDLTLCPWRLCCQGQCTQCYRTAFSAQGNSLYRAVEVWGWAYPFLVLFHVWMHPGWLYPPYAELQTSSRVSQHLHSLFFSPASCQSLQISAQLLVFYSTLEATSFVGWHFFIFPSLFLRNLQSMYTSPGLLAHRWQFFFRAVKLNLTSHETIETAFAFQGSSFQVLAFPCLSLSVQGSTID